MQKVRNVFNIEEKPRLERMNYVNLVEREFRATGRLKLLHMYQKQQRKALLNAWKVEKFFFMYLLFLLGSLYFKQFKL